MASEGSREIEAARQRLNAARAQKQSAAKMLESAKAMYSTAAKEVQAAETCLKGAEKRWEVIEVDDDKSTLGIQSSNKRRKVSIGNGTKGRGIALPLRASMSDASRIVLPSNSGSKRDTRMATPQGHALASAALRGAMMGRKERSTSRNPAVTVTVTPTSNSYKYKKVKVTVCGLPILNGTYERGNTRYYKKGGYWWKGELKQFVIGRECDHWYIGPLGGKTMYLAPVSSESLSRGPPNSGWRATKYGVSPEPMVRYVRGSDIV